MARFHVVREIALYNDFDAIVGYQYEFVEATATEDWAVIRARRINAELGFEESGDGGLAYRAMDLSDYIISIFTSKELKRFEAEHNARLAAGDDGIPF